MDNISGSLENLKSIYLHEIHQDISLELDEKILEAKKSQGFERLTFWKSFADKWLFVIAQRMPDLFEVFNGIFNDVYEIVEEGKQDLQSKCEEEKNKLNEKIGGLLGKVKKLEENEELKEKEVCKKANCVEEKTGLQEEINKLTLKCEKIQNMLKDDKEMYLQVQVQELQSKVEECEKVIGELKAKVKGDEEVIRELRESNEKYLKIIEGLEQDKETVRDLQERVEKLTLENQALRESSAENESFVQDSRLSQLEKENSELVIQNNSLMEQLTEFQLMVQPSIEKIPSYSKIVNSSSVSMFKGNGRKDIIPKQPSKKQFLKTRIAQSRELTLKQLKETIEEIYASKVKFDEKCLESSQPRETMDQFLHTYLNQKYGLKSLIVEWSVLILKATEKYESQDAEICLFSKILSHRIEETFRFTFEKLKEKIKQSLKSLIQQQYPYMREIQILNLLKEKMSGILFQPEWESIINSILSKDEATYLVNAINALTEQKESKLVIGKRNKLIIEKNEPTYAEVQNALLKYDLDAHETLLEPFWKLFVEEDRDNNGILNEDEFKGLCCRINLEAEVDRLLDLVDPNTSGFINFSDCVNLFSYEMVDNGEQNSISVVHSLFFSRQNE